MTKQLVVLIAPDRHGKTTVLNLAKAKLGKRVRCKEWSAPDESERGPFVRFADELDAFSKSRATYAVWGRSWIDTLFYERYYAHRRLDEHGYGQLLDKLLELTGSGKLKLTFATIGRPLELVNAALRLEQLERNPSVSNWFLDANVEAAQSEAGLFSAHIQLCLHNLPDLFPDADFTHMDNGGSLGHLEKQTCALFS
jgi:hypothetical protein